MHDLIRHPGVLWQAPWIPGQARNDIDSAYGTKNTSYVFQNCQKYCSKVKWKIVGFHDKNRKSFWNSFIQIKKSTNSISGVNITDFLSSHERFRKRRKCRQPLRGLEGREAFAFRKTAKRLVTQQAAWEQTRRINK